MSNKISIIYGKKNELYLNENGIIFGRTGKFHFRMTETKINAIDTDDLKELNLYVKWKFAKSTIIVPDKKREEFFVLFDLLLTMEA